MAVVVTSVAVAVAVAFFPLSSFFVAVAVVITAISAKPFPLLYMPDSNYIFRYTKKEFGFPNSFY